MYGAPKRVLGHAVPHESNAAKLPVLLEDGSYLRLGPGEGQAPDKDVGVQHGAAGGPTGSGG
jgi:hypothetical protein